MNCLNPNSENAPNNNIRYTNSSPYTPYKSPPDYNAIIRRRVEPQVKEEAEEESFSSDNDGSECLNYIPQEGSVHNMKEMELDLDFQGKGPKILGDI